MPNAADFLGFGAPDQAPASNVPSAEDFLNQPEQMTGSMRLPAMAASNLAKGVMQAPSIAGLPLRLYDQYIGVPFSNWVDRTFGSGTHQMQTGAFRTPGSPLYMAGPEDFVNLGKAAGIVDRPDLQPKTTGERYLAAGAEGVGGAVPYALLGDLPDAGRALAQGGGGGVGAQVAQDLLPDWLPGKRYIAPTLGAIGGALAGGKTFDIGSRGVNAVGNPSKTVTAYRDVGVTPRLAGDVTGDPTLQRVQAFSAQSPGGATRTQAAMKQSVDEFGNAVDQVAGKLGDSTTLQQAGEKLQAGGKQWLDDFADQNRALWAKADSHFSPGERIPVANYVNALDSVGQSLPGAPATAKVLQPAISGRLTEALQQDVGTGSLIGATLPYEAVKGIRTRVGQLLSDPNLPADVDTASLKQLYAGLSKDIQVGTAAKSPMAFADFNAASGFTRDGHEFIDNVLRPVVRKGVTPEQAASTALGMAPKGGTSLEALRAEIPDAANELAAYKLRYMAAAKPGQVGNYSPVTFDTNMRALSPEARSVLFEADPQIAKKIGSLQTVAESMKETAQKINTSNTGPYLATKTMLEAPEKAAYGGAAGYAVGGVPGALLGATAGAAYPFAPGLLGANLTTRPLLTQLLSASPMETSPAIQTGALLGPTVQRLQRQAPNLLAGP